MSYDAIIKLIEEQPMFDIEDDGYILPSEDEISFSLRRELDND